MPDNKPAFGTNTEQINLKVAADTLNLVSINKERDFRLNRMDLMVQGDPDGSGIPPIYDGASETESTLMMQAHFQEVAELTNALRHEQWFMASSVEDGQEDSAEAVENYLNGCISKYDLPAKFIGPAIFNTCRHPYCIGSVMWDPEQKIEYHKGWKDQQGNLNYDETELDPAEKYTEIQDEVQVSTGKNFKFEVYHAEDVYLDPVSSDHPETAERVVIRQRVTKRDLFLGITDYQYDKESVMYIIQHGKEILTDPERETRSKNGVEETTEGPLTVYMVWGKPPMTFEDDELLLSDDELKKDYLWFFEESTKKVYRSGPAPCRTRPFCSFPFMAIPGQLMGNCPTTMAQGMQIEDTVALRARMDIFDQALRPVTLCAASMFGNLQNVSVGAGSLIPVPANVPMDGYRPLPVDPRGFQAAMENAQDINVRVQQLFSSRTLDPNGPNNRTAREISLVASSADSKREVIRGNFMAGVLEMGKIILGHMLEFMNDGDDSITGEQLAANVMLQVNGDSSMSDPQLQFEQAEMLYKFVMSNQLVTQHMQQGDFTPLWEASYSFIRALRMPALRNPEKIIGPRPQPGADPASVLAVIFQKLQMEMQDKGPGGQLAQQIMQILQQTIQQVQQVNSQQNPMTGGAMGGQNPMAMAQPSPMGGDSMGALAQSPSQIQQ